MAVVRKSLVDILLEKRFVTAEQANEVREALQSGQTRDAGQLIIEKGWAVERDVYQAKAEEMNLPFVDLVKHQPESSAINVVPVAVAQKYKALPVKKDGQTLWVAMEDPRNLQATDDIRMVSRCLVRPMMAVPADLEAAMKKAYAGMSAAATPAVASQTAAAPAGGLADMQKLMREMGPGDLDEAATEAASEKEAESAPVVRMANMILVQAIEKGASDIHIEPDARSVRIRYRIDGVLQQIMTVPNHIKGPLIARYKIMSDMNIAERRVPQDGRIPIKKDNKEYDMRVSCLPSLFGEKIVMRILDKGSVLIGLNKLGFKPDVQNAMEELVSQPNGMFLVTGPTGSGKTTTLYSVLNKLNNIEKNIITVEDPIEYQLSGITQVGINKKAGLDFNKALRSFLRQDPDIIMVGEMRDLETADIAIEAALTGHLVLSTLHTNDAPSAVMRLADMGVEPFLIAATVMGVLAQRLTRRNCADCREKYTVKAEQLVRFGYGTQNEQLRQVLVDQYGLDPENPEADIVLERGKGCETCGGKGFKGRLGCYELLVVNAEIAEMIVRRAPVNDLRAAAKAAAPIGMKEMREDGLLKILDGVTTPEEVQRVVFTAGQ